MLMEVDDDELPSAAECQKRSEEFARITQTDTALAMMFLQDRAWDLERALDAFFSEMGSPVPITKPQSTFRARFPTEPSEARRVRVMSWNLDGLDQQGLARRSEFAAACILSVAPHVVLLQELVPQSVAVLRHELSSDYDFVLQTKEADYFCGLLVHRSCCNIHASGTVPFENSTMGRAMVWGDIQVKTMSTPCLFVTAHLESTKDFSECRKQQLKLAWAKLREREGNTMLGGDLNLRDSEVNDLGGLPSSIQDVWEATGSRSIAKVTWDPRRNTNAAALVGSRVPGLRFDRLMLKPARSGTMLVPRYFELSGIEKVPGSSSRFVSDHWAILGHFDIDC